MLVAIHQPNYMPWLGYFYKLLVADVLVLLDDVQFSKGSYTNRVGILDAKGPTWLTLPVVKKLGDKISEVRPARVGWQRSHLDALRNAYKGARHFDQVFPEMKELYEELPIDNLATINRAMIERIANRLGISARLVNASALGHAEKVGDERLISLTREFGASSSYLSGSGGAKYQDPAKFHMAGLGFRYSKFQHLVYDQGRTPFVPGMSALDAVFCLGWQSTATLIRQHAIEHESGLTVGGS